MEWAAVALALRTPDDDALRSRLPTYAHPLAGRTIAWHALRPCTSVTPAAASLLYLHHPAHSVPPLTGLQVQAVAWEPERASSELLALLPEDCARVVLLDGAAAGLSEACVAALVKGDGEAVVRGEGGVVAVAVPRARLEDTSSLSLDALARCARPLPDAVDDAFLVRDREGLARASRAVRDRLVRRLMRDGVTFLLPGTVLVDVDVTIGADTIIYPGVVLEGQTTIGEEAVIGPGCRIIDSTIGRGAELKGWNYVAGVSIRNRAVLEPYVRRGFD